MNEEISDELKRLAKNCAMKRNILLKSALLKSKKKKWLTVASGLLALFSAGAITTVIVKFIGNESLQIIAALTAAISGFISLMTTVFYSEEETSKRFAASSNYLALREKAKKLLIQPNASDKQIFRDFESLYTEYAELDKLYSKYSDDTEFAYSIAD